MTRDDSEQPKYKYFQKIGKFSWHHQYITFY